MSFSDIFSVPLLASPAVAAVVGLSHCIGAKSRAKHVNPPVSLSNQSVLVNEEERIYRSAQYGSGKELLSTFYADVNTLYETFQRGVRLAGNNPCMGTRTSASTPWSWSSYNEINQRINNFGNGLLHENFELGQKTFVGLYSKNRPEWVIAEQACHRNAHVTVPLYDTLGPDAVEFIVKQANIALIVLDVDKIKKLEISLTRNKEAFKSLKMIVIMDNGSSEELTSFSDRFGIKCVSFKHIESLGEGNKILPFFPASPEDVATICYTSGTTGDPKGAILTHSNIVSDVSSVMVLIQNHLTISNEDVHLSFLPLAHMFERALQAVLWMHAARVGFLREGNPLFLLEDLASVRPTIFAAVPRVLTKIHDRVMAGVEKASTIKKSLFQVALKAKLQEVAEGIIRTDSLWDKLVFKKISALFGGRVKWIITGAAPINASILNFFRAALGAHVSEAYGQTEATAGCTATIIGDHSGGNVGAPLPCNEIKLVDVPDLNYFAKNNQGEVCFRGNNVFKGYFNDEEKSKAAIDKDGWLHSGDVGQWLPNGTLKIIDRAKHMFKLAQGEYVAPEKIENIYTRHTAVAQMFVYGDSLETCLVGIVVPDADTFSQWAISKGFSGELWALCSQSAVTKALLTELKELGKKSGLNSFEQVFAIKLVPTPFSVENDLLTPTQKAKRPQLKTAFITDIQHMYMQLRTSSVSN